MKAPLLVWHKARIAGRYIVELKIHQIEKSSRYPDGIKCGLICKDLKMDRKVLMDNHHPKGHHVHLDDQEYSYRNTDVLVDDFEQFVLEHLEVEL